VQSELFRQALGAAGELGQRVLGLPGGGEPGPPPLLNWYPRIAAPVGEPDGLLHRAFGELAGTDPAASV
jgi:hypothetical protein